MFFFVQSHNLTRERGHFGVKSCTLGWFCEWWRGKRAWKEGRHDKAAYLTAIRMFSFALERTRVGLCLLALYTALEGDGLGARYTG